MTNKETFEQTETIHLSFVQWLNVFFDNKYGYFLPRSGFSIFKKDAGWSKEDTKTAMDVQMEYIDQLQPLIDKGFDMKINTLYKFWCDMEFDQQVNDLVLKVDE